ncbi:MAG: hypothetical protein MUF54_24825 [Polyangiaceae bacterium]|nr:hypothetical protein [Polyangiaceae bacterium]
MSFESQLDKALRVLRGVQHQRYLAHRGGKRRFDPSQVAKGVKEELEHAATIKKIQRSPFLPVKKAAELIVKDHLKASPHHYDRAEAVAVPKRAKGLKSPRLKLLHKVGKLRVYLVDSHKVRRKLPDWTMGGHGVCYRPEIPRNEVWIAEEVFGPERILCTIHECHEFKLMGGGQDYDTAHDASTALEQEFRVGGRKDMKATLRRKLKEAAATCV